MIILVRIFQQNFVQIRRSIRIPFTHFFPANKFASAREISVFARARSRVRVRCSARTPATSVCTRPAVCSASVCVSVLVLNESVCVARARVRPRSDLEPPRSSRDPSLCPRITSPSPRRPRPPPDAQYLPPLSPSRNCFPLSRSVLLSHPLTLSLSFALSRTLIAMGSIDPVCRMNCFGCTVEPFGIGD